MLIVQTLPASGIRTRPERLRKPQLITVIRCDVPDLFPIVAAGFATSLTLE